MFKIYSLALLGLLCLQNSYAAEQREEFYGESIIRRRMEAQHKEVENLQRNMGKIIEYYEKTLSQPSNPSSKKFSEEKSSNEENLQVSNIHAINFKEEMKRFTNQLENMKKNLSKEFLSFIDLCRSQHRDHQEDLQKEATKYRQLGITSLLKGIDEENLPLQERSPCVSLYDFPLTFDRPDYNSSRVYFRISEEDRESLRASGVNQELIDNLFSHLQTDVSALYDMVQRGYQARQEQNRQ